MQKIYTPEGSSIHVEILFVCHRLNISHLGWLSNHSKIMSDPHIRHPWKEDDVSNDNDIDKDKHKEEDKDKDHGPLTSVRSPVVSPFTTFDHGHFYGMIIILTMLFWMI